MKKTPWINCNTPPVRPGYYEVRLWDEMLISAEHSPARRWYFDGKHWRTASAGARFVAEERPGWHKKDEWRGRVAP